MYARHNPNVCFILPALVRARDVMAAAPAQLVQRAWIELERAHP